MAQTLKVPSRGCYEGERDVILTESHLVYEPRGCTTQPNKLSQGADKDHGVETGKDLFRMAESKKAALRSKGLRVKLLHTAKGQNHRQHPPQRAQAGRPHLFLPHLRELLLGGQVLLPPGGHMVHTITRPGSRPAAITWKAPCPRASNFSLCFSSLPGPNPGSNQMAARTEGPSTPSETAARKHMAWQEGAPHTEHRPACTRG